MPTKKIQTFLFAQHELYICCLSLNTTTSPATRREKMALVFKRAALAEISFYFLDLAEAPRLAIWRGAMWFVLTFG